MINSENVTIVIEFKLINEESWRNLVLKPIEYFDLDEDEVVTVDSVPLYSDSLDYISEFMEKVEFIKTIIVDSETNNKRVFLETLWNNQFNRITERIDSGIGFNDYELIIQSKVKSDPPTFEILRIIKKEGSLIPIYHGFISENEDGSASEINIIG